MQRSQETRISLRIRSPFLINGSTGNVLIFARNIQQKMQANPLEISGENPVRIQIDSFYLSIYREQADSKAQLFIGTELLYEVIYQEEGMGEKKPIGIRLLVNFKQKNSSFVSKSSSIYQLFDILELYAEGENPVDQMNEWIRIMSKKFIEITNVDDIVEFIEGASRRDLQEKKSIKAISRSSGKRLYAHAIPYFTIEKGKLLINPTAIKRMSFFFVNYSNKVPCWRIIFDTEEKKLVILTKWIRYSMLDLLKKNQERQLKWYVKKKIFSNISMLMAEITVSNPQFLEGKIHPEYIRFQNIEDRDPKPFLVNFHPHQLPNKIETLKIEKFKLCYLFFHLLHDQKITEEKSQHWNEIINNRKHIKIKDIFDEPVERIGQFFEREDFMELFAILNKGMGIASYESNQIPDAFNWDYTNYLEDDELYCSIMTVSKSQNIFPESQEESQDQIQEENDGQDSVMENQVNHQRQVVGSNPFSRNFYIYPTIIPNNNQFLSSFSNLSSQTFTQPSMNFFPNYFYSQNLFPSYSFFGNQTIQPFEAASIEEHLIDESGIEREEKDISKKKQQNQLQLMGRNKRQRVDAKSESEDFEFQSQRQKKRQKKQQKRLKMMIEESQEKEKRSSNKSKSSGSGDSENFNGKMSFEEIQIKKVSK